MACRLCLPFVAFLAVGFNEAAASQMKVKSKAEIRANMTLEHAVKVFMHSNHSQGQPAISLLIQDKLSHSRVQRSNLRAVKQHSTADASAATEQINAMMLQTQAMLDNEAETCSTFAAETMRELELIRQDVAGYNGQAAEARAKVIAQQNIVGFVENKLPLVEDQLKEHSDECENEQAALAKEVKLVEHDLDIVNKVLKTEKCRGGPIMLQCRKCRSNGRSVVMLQSRKAQPLLDKLQSQAALSSLDRELAGAAEGEPVMLLQASVVRRGRKEDPGSEVPSMTFPSDCAPEGRCTISSAMTCKLIRERMLVMQSDLVDKKEDLSAQMGRVQKDCEDARSNMNAQMADLNDRSRQAQEALASATQQQVSAESSSTLKGQQHAKLSQDYAEKMKSCCDNQNSLKSELCALEKIRGELQAMNGGDNAQVTDCEVSEWEEGKCSEACGGGTMKKTRSIIVHPNGGMACPPLELQESCNTHPCPVDCVVGDWEGWSSCSAECDGGVRERMRPVITEMQHSGAPCDRTEETEACGVEACNVECVLADWGPWGACSKACDTGSMRRVRGIATPAKGTATCPAAHDEERIDTLPCNERSCDQFMHASGNHQYVKCISKLDLVVLMDGSGSLGQDGWSAMQGFTEALLNNLVGGKDHVQVALQIFSGPKLFEEYNKCTGTDPDSKPDLEKDCGIKWVKHFTDKPDEVAKLVKDATWPGMTTLTSLALAQAEAELLTGREDAASVVVVVTDGQPASRSRTIAAARQLMTKSRIIWVAVGPSAPMDLFEEVASRPKSENIIEVEQVSKLGSDYFVNKVITNACPQLEPAA